MSSKFPCRTQPSAYTGVALPAALFLCFSIVYVVLGTRDYCAVDGALATLRVFRSPLPFLDDNNHLLFPLETYLWAKTLALVGLKPASPFAFVRLAQIMNAIVAAVSVWLLFIVVRQVTGAGLYALLAALGFALSRAVIMHATSSAQPLVGLMFSLAAVSAALRGIRSESRIWFVVSGVLLAVAMSSYETMVLVGPALLLVAFAFGGLSSFLGGCISGWILTFGVAYFLSGTSAVHMPNRFTTSVGMPIASVGIRLSSIVNLPVGLTAALLPIPARYSGIRWLIRQSWDTIALAAGVVIFVNALLLWILVALFQARAALGSCKKWTLAYCTIAFISTMFPLIVVNPMYDKFWLQPIVILCVIFAAAAQVLRGRTGVLIAALLILAELSLNLPIAIASAQRQTPHLDEARIIASAVGPSDLVVTDWDDLSQYYAAFWPERQVFCLPTEAGLDGTKAIGRMNERIGQTTSVGGHVFFLTVLDPDEKAWNQGYLVRTGIPYGSLQHYRDCSVVVKVLMANGGRETLRRLDSGSCKP